MFQWRLKLRKAGEALAAGQVDEARRLLDDEQLREFLPAKKLAGQVAEQFAQRARQRIAWGESAAGMADLDAAEQLGAPASMSDSIRLEYAAAAARHAFGQLAAAEPDAARQRLDRANRRGVVSQLLRDAGEIAAAWSDSRGQANAGEMAAAREQLERAARLTAALDRGPNTIEVAAAIAREEASLAERATDHRTAHERLHKAAAAKTWDEALTAADECLQLAPADPIALSLRRRLWKEVGLGLTKTHPGRRMRTPLAMPPSKMPSSKMPRNNREIAGSLRRADAKAAPRKSTRSRSMSTDDTNAGAPPADRRMLWIDAVGGFLVCLDDEIVLGQPAAGTTVPILADVSRRHAVLRREAGAYVLQPLGEVLLDGKPITGPTVLGDENVIQLGGDSAGQGGVRLRFTRPHALSSTARLVMESGHRTSPAADAVLLMADSCVLGPGAHSHVRCADWKEDVILFRKPTGSPGAGAGDELQCRSNAPLSIDGVAVAGAGNLVAGSRIEGEDFALSVEEV
ncbi:MAG: FHA domain-containing protein [Planctomycetota bacterium]